MEDLQKFESCHPVTAPASPSAVKAIISPLVPKAWEEELQDHPDREFCRYIVSGIRHGFRVGFDYYKACECASRNMQSAAAHPEVIDKGRIIGPLQPEWRQCVQISHFGVIPKPHQPGKWRLITDLSFPHGFSVNDGISSAWCSLTYASVDDAVQRIRLLGRSALLAKFDIASAYRVVPVHPDDRMLLGMVWRDQLYVDGALPLGLRSAPKLFMALADGLLWCMGRHGVKESLHYLDDFLVMGEGHSDCCSRALRISLDLCRKLGFPIANHKVEGPSSCLPFLGILIDTE